MEVSAILKEDGSAERTDRDAAVQAIEESSIISQALAVEMARIGVSMGVDIKDMEQTERPERGASGGADI